MTSRQDQEALKTAGESALIAQRSIAGVQDSMQNWTAVQTDVASQMHNLAKSFRALALQAQPTYLIQEEP